MRPIPIHIQGDLALAEHAELENAIQGLHTLADVLDWGRAQSPSWTVVEIVTQDEYTHDVVLGTSGRPYLAFDTT